MLISGNCRHTAGDGVRSILERLLAIPDEALFTADFFIADWKVHLRSTCPKTTETYTSRLCGRRPDVAPNASLTLSLFEANALEWFPSESFSAWRLRGRFELMLKTLGYLGVYPDATEGEAGTDPLTIFDPGRQIGVQLVPDIRHLPPWDAGAPCRIQLHLAAASRGWCLVHGATLALGHNGVLIVGPGGAGKSHTTLAGISAGLNTAGDDYVLVSPTNPPIAFRVYNLLKQDRNGLSRIDGLAARTAHCKPNWQGKLELDPEELFPGCMVEHVRLSAILVPEVAHAPRTRLLPIEPQHVFRQLAPSLWTQLPGAQIAGFRFATWLTRSLPTYCMQLSSEPAEIGDSIGNFIAGLKT